MSIITMSSTDPGEGSALANDNFVAVYGGKSLLDMFYPVGTYYETSDTAFDPNTAWGGVWQKDTTGRVTIAQDSSTFSAVGNTGGAETHRHDFMIGLHRYFGALVGDDLTDAGAWSMAQGKFSKQSGILSATSTNRNNALQAGMTTYNETIVTSTGDTDTASSLPPYIVVVRWHRTA